VETDPLKESPGREVHWRIQEFDSRTKTWKEISLSEVDEDFTVTIELETQPRGPKKKHPPKRIEFETQPR
jgi:hypothetical protein